MAYIALNFMNSHNQDIDSLAHHPVLLACQEFVIEQTNNLPSDNSALTKRLNKISHLIKEFHKLNTLFEFIGSIEMSKMAADSDPFDFNENFNTFEDTITQYQQVLSQLREIRTNTLKELSKPIKSILTVIK